MTKIACFLLRIYVRRENTQTGIQLCFNLVFTTASQKSNLNRKIYVFRLFPTEWIFSRLAFTLCQAKIVLCFLHEWRLHPSYVTDNGGNVGGKNGGVPSLSPAVPSSPQQSPALSQVLSQVLSQDEEKDASIDAKDATSSSKVATLDEEAANLADNGRNSVIRKQRQELHKELQ